MALPVSLPQLAVITPALANPRGGYTYYMTETEELRGYVSSSGQDIFSPFAKIEIERAKIDGKFVHLRFSASNKYWARRGVSDWLIFASSNQPEEDKSKWYCTLFEPVFQSDGHFYLIHVHSGKRVRINESGQLTGRLFVDDNDRGPGHTSSSSNTSYAFRVIDWDTLVIMPKNVAFKGDNGKYLKAGWIEKHEYHQFSSDDGNEEATAYEVTPNPDGHIRIKSRFFGKFWRRSPNWIWADSTDTDGRNVDTLFWPVKVDGSTIALRNAGNDRFCKRLTTEGKTNCLNAAVSTITREARLVVEELVSERRIYDVVYHMENARIFDEKVIIAGSGSAVNDTQKDSVYTIKISYSDTSSYSFKNSLSIMLGVKTTIQTGFPGIVEGKIEIGAEVTTSLEWDRTTTETKSAEASYEMTVPAMSSVRVDYVATRGTCNVPFSYTQRDRRSTDGSFLTSTHVDGVYTGVNNYSFQFHQPVVTRLG